MYTVYCLSSTVYSIQDSFPSSMAGDDFGERQMEVGVRVCLTKGMSLVYCVGWTLLIGLTKGMLIFGT